LSSPVLALIKFAVAVPVLSVVTVMILGPPKFAAGFEVPPKVNFTETPALPIRLIFNYACKYLMRSNIVKYNFGDKKE